MRNWANAEMLFDELNKSYSYVVIRNFEEFYGSITSEDHADIDLLCYRADKDKIVRFLDAKYRLDKDDGIHYQVSIQNEYVPIDMRYDGDGYYDAQWEKNMLDSRVLEDRGFFIMSKENYFWSLLYHALYHKGNISEEYYKRLESFYPSYFPAESFELEQKLSDYMKEKGYFYTISRDKYLWYHFTTLCEGRIKAYPSYYIKKCFYKIGHKVKIIVRSILK